MNFNQSFVDYKTVTSTIVSFEVLIGSLANGFMVTASLIDCASRRKLGSCESILICLGLSRFAFLWTLFFMYLMSVYLTSLNGKYTDAVMYIFLCFSNSSLWYATWLCMFYCVRIVNISNCIFVVFKKNFDRCLPILLLGSLAISVAFSLLLLCNSLTNVDFISSSNSQPLGVPSKSTSRFLITSFIGSAPPFLVFCIAAWLVVYSLTKHTRRMKEQERTSFKEPSLEAHYGAVKSVGHFFLFYAIYIISFNLYQAGIASPNSIEGLFCTVLTGSYPSVHSVLLLLQNNKLQQTLISFWQKISCYHHAKVKKAESTSTCNTA
ncbi:hypothetical protein XENTR_v10017951 [Xenopus tropicalis]|uniref:Taste receptor type 2 n=1 Tax=Xenopus tropicalis TaxID=8364 RepID=F6T8C8_XENTR|nr:hypothetical protein XENTR_v10017951 [Xenopus tropicalis]